MAIDNARVEVLLKLSKAKVIQEEVAGLTSDGELSLRWDGIPIGLLEQASDWEFSNRVTITGQEIDQQLFDGIYRSVEITTELDRTAKNGSLVHKFAKGYITELVSSGTLDWSEARLVWSRDLPAGTLADPLPSGTAGDETGGNTEENYLVCHWPNTSPSHVETIIESINALTVGTFSPTIKGQAYGDNWHRIWCRGEIENDGSATIIMLVAKPEFSLDSFNGVGSPQRTDVGYRWNVPKELAQGILDAWKGVAGGRGLGATCRYNPEQGLVDIVLYEKNSTADTLSDANMLENCSTQHTVSFSWGGTDNTTLPIPGTVPTGTTYRRTVYNNKDGSFDVILTKIDTLERVDAIGTGNDFPDSSDGETRRRVSREFTVDEWQDLGLSSTTAIDLTDAVNFPRDDGEIFNQRINVKADCSKDVITSVQKVVAQSGNDYDGQALGDRYGYHGTYTTQNGTAFFANYKHATAAQVAAGLAYLGTAAYADNSNSANATKEENGLFSYTLRSTPPSASYDATHWADETWYTIKPIYKNNGSQVKLQHLVHEIEFHATAGAAESHVNGKDAMEGSKVTRVNGAPLYMSYVVYTNTVVDNQVTAFGSITGITSTDGFSAWKDVP